MPRPICGLALLLIVLSGCGGAHTPQAGNTPTPTPTPSGALTVCGTGADGKCENPTLVPFGGTAQFMATASSGTPPTVNWSVNGVQGGSSSTGTISSGGLFTAPGNFDSGKSVTITATSTSNSSITGSGSALILNTTGKETPPVLMGTSGGNSTDSVTSGKTITCCSGTLGSLIQSGAGNFFILSNNHVLDKSGQGTPGDPITQPGLIDNNCSPATIVANLTAGSAIKPNPCNGNPCSGPAPSNVDAAIAKVVAGLVDTSGNVLDLGAVNGAGINPAPPSATLADLTAALATNAQVAKVGRSSGLTCSTLQSTETNVSVQYNAACGGAVAFTAVFTNQVVVNGGSFSAAGDSGSLIVTAADARPLALLFAGNSNSTTGNSISDVLKRPEFNIGGTPTMVGGGDHAVSCSAVASSGTLTTAVTSLSPQETARVSAVRQRRAAGLMQDPAVKSTEIAASQDSPGEGALLIHLEGPAGSALPPVMDGVRTAVISKQQASQQIPILNRQDIENARTIKEAHAAELMFQSGIQGVGVGRSSDNPSETAIVIYVVAGEAHAPIPATIDGVRTKIIAGDRFRAFGWGKEKDPGKCTRR